MSSSVATQDLGPFAAARGALSPLAAAGGALGATAAALFWTTAGAVPVGGGAAILSLIGLYQVGARGRRGRSLAIAGLLLGLGGAIGALVYNGVRQGEVDLTGFGNAYFNGRVLSLIWRDMLRAAGNTIKLATIAEGLGVAVGLIVATLALSKRLWLRVPALAYVDVIRGLPLLMLLILLFFGLTFVGIRLPIFTAAILGLTINTSAYVAEIFRAGIQSIERGQMDAARSLGMPYPTAMVFVVIPQAVRRVIPPLTNEFIALLKDTSLVIILGTTPAGRELMAAARQGAAATFSPTPYMTASLLYLAMTLPLTRLVTWMERRLRAGLA